MQPNAENRFLFWGTATTSSPDLVAPAITLFDADEQKTNSYQLGAGWSHTFSYQNVLTGAVVATRARQLDERFESIDGLFVVPGIGAFPAVFDTSVISRTRVDTVTAALGHTFGFADVTLRSGIEAQRGRVLGYTFLGQSVFIPAGPLTLADETTETSDTGFNSGRAYTNAMWQPSDRFQVEAGVTGLLTEVEGSARETYVDPRIGAAFSPANGHWLRAAWRRDTETFSGFSLSPITTVGLLPHALPVSLGGRRDTTALRWEAEWTPHIFTAFEYQNQQARDLSIPLPDTLDSYALPKGRIDYLTATANIWLTHGVGLFGTIGAAETSTDIGTGTDAELPYVPRRFARAGLTFVHPSRIRFSLVENYIGKRFDSPGGVEVDEVWTTDANATYETPDRRFLLSLSALNLFDERYDLVAARPGASEAITGAGRTLAGSLKVRF
jgi:hypothetical protein